MGCHFQTAGVFQLHGRLQLLSDPTRQPRLCPPLRRYRGGWSLTVRPLCSLRFQNVERHHRPPKSAILVFLIFLLRQAFILQTEGEKHWQLYSGSPADRISRVSSGEPCPRINPNPCLDLLYAFETAPMSFSFSPFRQAI